MRAPRTLALGLGAFALLGALPESSSASAAERPADRRVLVVAVDPSSVGAWQADRALAPLLDDGSVALLSTRAGSEETDRERRARAAFATLGAGARRGADAEGSALAEALVQAGVPFVVSRGLQSPLAASPLRTIEGALPGDLAVPAVAVVDARADSSLVTRARAILNPDDMLIVLSVAPPARGGIHLGVIAVAGGGVPPGLLSSPSTRREGVVTLTDVAPSILDALSLEIPDSMEGRRFRSIARSDGGDAGGGDAIVSLEHDLILSHDARRPLTRGMLVIAMAAVIGALLMIWRRARRGHTALTAVLAASVAAPLSLYLVGALRPSSVTVAALEASCLAFVVGNAALFGLGRARGLAAVCSLTAIVPIADLFAGSPLATRSPLAFQVAGGGRFYGVDDGVLGMVVGAQIVAAGLILDRLRNRWVTGALAAWIALTVWTLGSPSYGSKFGAALTAVPAFGVFAVRATGRKVDARAIVAIASVAVAATVFLVLSDTVRDSDAQSHVARAATGSGDLGDTLARKVEATWEITVHNIWSRAIVVFGAALYLLRRLRAPATPGARAALLGIVVGAIAGISFNDEGVITATPMLLVAATAASVSALDRDTGPTGSA